MANNFNIYISLENSSLKEELASLISSDWSLPWRILGSEHYFADTSFADVVLYDNKSLEFKISNNSAKIFTEINSSEYTSESLFLRLKHEYIVNDIRKQNQLSTYSTKAEDTFLLENTANSLNKHIEELMSQAKMRRELVEQLPIGVIGVDDEGLIVIANEKAIEILNLKNSFIFGMEIQQILSKEVTSFIKDDSVNELEIKIDKNIKIRKSNFELDNNFAGTILVLWDE